VGGERHRAGDRDEQEDQEKLLEEECLHACIGREIGAAGERLTDPQQIPIVAEMLARGGGDPDRNRERQRERHDRHEGDGQERCPIASEIQELLVEQRSQTSAGHGPRREWRPSSPTRWR
jgi:hypothetical protein